ncbi:unnamed protein product, partial [Polarella glacialis]
SGKHGAGSALNISFAQSQEAALRYGTTLPLRRAPRPVSGIADVTHPVARRSQGPVVASGPAASEGFADVGNTTGPSGDVTNVLLGSWPHRTRPHSAVVTSASKEFAAALAAGRGSLSQQFALGESSGMGARSTSIGSLLGRQQPNSPPSARQEEFGARGGSHGSRPATALRRAASAGALGRQVPLPRQTLPYRVTADVTAAPDGRPGFGPNLSASLLFEECIRRDRAYGQLLREIKAAYDGFLRDRGVTSPPTALISMPSTVAPVEDTARSAGEALGAAEMAVEAARRPWIEDIDGSTTERRDGKEVISSSRRRAPAKVKKLEKENEALRELVRRFRTELCGGVSAIPPIAIGTMKPAPAVGALRHPSPRPASAAGSFCSE